MSKKDKNNQTKGQAEDVQEQQAPAAQPEGEQNAPQAQPEQTADPLLTELESLKDQVARQEDKYLRLAAEYDNYRKRTAKEKESAFLPVYDNLERALKQDTADEAFKKGVEMTMTQLKDILAKLGITEIPALGQTDDPNLHNAVMHVEDESLGENTVAEVFQAGFQCGEKVIRFAMVKVAN